MEDKILQMMKKNHISTEMYYLFTDEFKETKEKIQLRKGYIVNLLKTKYGLTNIPLDFINGTTSLSEIPKDCPYTDLLEELINLRNEEANLYEWVRNSYIKSFEGRPADILNDIKTNLSYETHQTVLDFFRHFSTPEFIELCKKQNRQPPTIQENFIAYFSFFRNNLDEQFKAFTYWGIDEENPLYIEAIKIIEDKVISFGFPKPAEVITKEEVEEEQAKQAYIKPITKASTYSILNTRVSHFLLTDIQDAFWNMESNGQISAIINMPPEERATGIRVSKTNAKKPVLSYVSLTYDGDLSPSLARLNPNDKSRMNAICSLIDAGNIEFTLEDIARTPNGYKQGYKPSKKALEQIYKSLLKFGSTRIWLDVTDELNNHYFTADEVDERLEQGIIEEALLNYRIEYRKNKKGTTTCVVQVLSMPILMAYSKAKKQIVSIPTYLLNMQSVSATDEILVIREYLAKEIMLLKKGQRNKDIILFDTIKKECGLEVNDRTTKSRYVKFINDIMDEWATEDMKFYIKGHEVIKENTSVKGFKIII